MSKVNAKKKKQDDIIRWGGGIGDEVLVDGTCLKQLLRVQIFGVCVE